MTFTPKPFKVPADVLQVKIFGEPDPIAEFERGGGTVIETSMSMGVIGLVIEVPWPRYPTMTPGGKESRSKKAGRRIPWLNINTTKRMKWPVHAELIRHWRQEAKDAALEQVGLAWRGFPSFPVEISVKLFAPAKRGRDVSGILEGLKPIVDGLVQAGLLPDDYPQFVGGFKVEETEVVGRNGNAGVRLTLRSGR